MIVNNLFQPSGHHAPCMIFQILRPKCAKFYIGLASAPDPAGEFTALPRPSSWRGPTSEGRRVAEGKGMEVTGGKKGGGSEGMEGKGKWDAGPASRQVPEAPHW